MSAHLEHAEPRAVCWVISVSDTRTITTDASGFYMRQVLRASGHDVARRELIKNDPLQIKRILEELQSDQRVHVCVFVGGTGLSRKDHTARTLRPLLQEEIEGFGELFRALSYQEIGAHALLSRAIAGLVNRRLVFALPGSEHAVRLAAERLILPILSHAVHELQR